MHQKRDPTAVSQRLTQIQELQNEVNSVSDARDFYDPETANSSGASHVPSQPSTISSHRTMPSRDSGLPHDTRNTMGTSGNVYEQLQGGRLAMCSFRPPKLGMAPLSVPFRSEWAPLGGPGDRNFDVGARFRALLFFFVESKTIKVGVCKNQMKHPVDGPKMHVV